MKTRLVLTGGFLGGGKTSLGIELANYLRKKGRSASLITNDQSVGLVDTARVRHAGFPVEEVTGSCFCCNFNGLMAASEAFRNREKPEVIIAEPVGSCTDLMATISNPALKLHGTDYAIAPLSVIVDPIRFASACGILDNSGFSEKVLYIYQKQLEEAEIIVVNKVDLLDPDLRQMVVSRARAQFPLAKVFGVSCRTGEGLEQWFEEILSTETKNRPAIEVNYDTYAEGEALMGWLNASAEIPAPETAFNGNDLLLDISQRLNKSLGGRGVEIAHLKMTLTGEDGAFGSISLTRTGEQPTIIDSVAKISGKSELTVNLRAEADPNILRREVDGIVFKHNSPRIRSGKIDAFRPGRPNPTYRMASCAC